MFYAFTKSLNSRLVKPVPLSSTISVSGIPKRSNNVLSSVITAIEDVELTTTASTHLEWASTTTRM